MDSNRITPKLDEYKTQELRQKLLDCLDREAREFFEVARTYFTKDQLSQEDKTGLLQAVIQAVDHVSSAGDWESSLFLRNTIKPLMQIKSEAEVELAKLSKKAEESQNKETPLSENEAKVYVSLFQSDGYNIGKWAMQLRSLDRYVVGRPIYGNEEEMLARLRARAQAAVNEAYVIVVVKKTDIQHPAHGAAMKDQFGNPLVSLKEKALKFGRIAAFVHQGVYYQFVDGQLI